MDVEELAESSSLPMVSKDDESQSANGLKPSEKMRYGLTSAFRTEYKECSFVLDCVSRKTLWAPWRRAYGRAAFKADRVLLFSFSKDAVDKICWKIWFWNLIDCNIASAAKNDGGEDDDAQKKMLMRVEPISADAWLPERMQNDLGRCKEICRILDMARFGYVTDVFDAAIDSKNEDFDEDLEQEKVERSEVSVEIIEEALDWYLGYLLLVHGVDYYRGCWEFQQNLLTLKSQVTSGDKGHLDHSSDESEYLEFLIPQRTFHVRPSRAKAKTKPKRPSALLAQNSNEYKLLPYEEHWDQFLMIPCEDIVGVRVHSIDSDVTRSSKRAKTSCIHCRARFSQQIGGETIVEHFAKYHRTKKNIISLERYYDVLRCRLMYGLSFASMMCISKSRTPDTFSYGKLLSAVRSFRDKEQSLLEQKTKTHNQQNRGKTMDHSNDMSYQRAQKAREGGRKRNGRRDRKRRRSRSRSREYRNRPRGPTARLHADDIIKGHGMQSRSRDRGGRRGDRDRDRRRRSRSRHRRRSRSRSKSKRRSRSRDRRR